MKSRFSGFALIITLIALLSPTAHAKVETTLHREADLSRYKTFDLVRVGMPQGEPTIPKERVDATVRHEIELRLSKMGYVKSTGETRPDFRVQYNASSLEVEALGEAPRATIVPFNEAEWYAPEFETLSSSFARSTLFLTMRDGATDEPVWCGWITEPLSPGRLERRTKKSVRRILGHYPPMSDR
jgi:hypothetical protein